MAFLIGGITMKPVMRVNVTPSSLGTFMGLVKMPNLGITKLKKDDGGFYYSTVSNLRQAAVAAAKKYNATLVFATPKKVAAKKSVS